MLERKIVDVPVHDVEVDEIWGFVGMKEKTRMRYYSMSESVGDAWCFVGFESNTKLILSWHYLPSNNVLLPWFCNPYPRRSNL